METTDKAKWEGLNLRPDHNVVKKYLAKQKEAISIYDIISRLIDLGSSVLLEVRESNGYLRYFPLGSCNIYLGHIQSRR